MAQLRTETTSKPSAGFPVAAAVITALIAAGIGGFVLLDYQAKRAQPVKKVLTPEAKEYVRNLKLHDVEMNKHESYLKQSIVEITGKIENSGGRTMKSVHITCVFYDSYGQLTLRETVPIVGRKMGSLAPMEIKSFRLPFDNVPEGWNQAMPQLVIAEIVFE